MRAPLVESVRTTTQWMITSRSHTQQVLEDRRAVYQEPGRDTMDTEAGVPSLLESAELKHDNTEWRPYPCHDSPQCCGVTPREVQVRWGPSTACGYGTGDFPYKFNRSSFSPTSRHTQNQLKPNQPCYSSIRMD